MAAEKQTTVNLTEKAQEIKEDLAPIYGLKNILSAGLVLFGRLSDTEQKQVIRQANSLDPEDPEAAVASIIAEAEAGAKNANTKRRGA